MSGPAAGGTAARGGAPGGDVPLLQARGLTRNFRVRASRARPGGGLVRAVQDVTVALPRAAIIAIVGESGSGKSTLVKLLARLIRPTSGTLLLDGAPLPRSSRGRREFARQVQLVLQDPFSSLNPVHDVRYHLARPLRIHRLARTRPELDRAADGLLERVALTPPGQFRGKYPHELSGGQRQRVAIARALAVRPRVLLADEPVSMLDVSVRLGVLNLLADLRERDGLAIVYVTHDIASARYLADAICVMYAGRMVESGPAAVVTDAPAHPYTQLLIGAAPDPDRPAAARLTPGDAATGPAIPAGGCPFRPRCPHAMRVCADAVPALADLGGGHASACWLHADGLSAAERSALGRGERAAGLAPGRRAARPRREAR